MSEAANDKTPEVKLDAAGGFMPEPPPPRMTPEEAGLPPETAAEGGDAGSAAIPLADVQPDGSVAVPQDTARRALEAVQILVENNRSASEQLEALMGIVLDAAEVANRSASAVATSGGHVNRAAEKLIDGAQRSSSQAKLVLGIAGAILVGAAGVFSFMSVQLQNKVAQLDEMMLAVGKRAVDLKRRMESMDEIHASLEDLKLAQENTQSIQQVIEERIARLAEAPPAPPKPEAAPAATLSPEAQAARKAEAEKRAKAARERAARTEAENRQLLQQLTTLDAMLKDQAKAVKDLSGQFGSLQSSVTSTEQLAAQQKLREKEMAQELAAEKARREKEVRDKERELIRERERAREREAARERELAREREAAKVRQAAAEREAERQSVVSYRRDQSRPTGTPPDATLPTFTSSGGTQPAPKP